MSVVTREEKGRMRWVPGTPIPAEGTEDYEGIRLIVREFASRLLDEDSYRELNVSREKTEESLIKLFTEGRVELVEYTDGSWGMALTKMENEAVE